jgi:hypothetical protein
MYLSVNSLLEVFYSAVKNLFWLGRFSSRIVFVAKQIIPDYSVNIFRTKRPGTLFVPSTAAHQFIDVLLSFFVCG